MVPPDLETRVRLLESSAQEHTAITRERFEQGNKAFAALRESVGQLSMAVQPKPFTLAKALTIITITLTVFLAAAGSLWALSAKISDRPTIDQVRSVVNEHASIGHPALLEDVAGIKQEQAVQWVKLDNIEKAVGKIEAVVAPPVRKLR